MLNPLLRPTRLKRIVFFVIADVILSLITFYGAYQLRFNFNIPDEFLTPFIPAAIFLITLKVCMIALLGNYSFIWRFYSLKEAKNLLFALIIAYGVYIVGYLIVKEWFSPFPRSVIIIDFFLSLAILSAIRFAKRLILETGSHAKRIKPTLLIGISTNTSHLIKSALEGTIEYYPVGVVAVLKKNEHMIGSSIHNLKVMQLGQLEDFLSHNEIHAAIIEGSLPQENLKAIYSILQHSNIQEIKLSRLLEDDANKIETLSIEDLLARHPKDLDTRTIEDFIKGKKVLITGGGGSIGSEIALQASSFGASTLILIDHSEFNLYQIGERLPYAVLRLCNIVEKETLDSIIKEYVPDIIIHAAAYKHVPLCEANPKAAIENNIIGSQNVIDCTIENLVPKLIIISTDKAVRPTNIMGATKRVVELYAQNIDSKATEIVAVRFGNVLGSSGSVIPKFKTQIESGGPITITHPEIERYFMLIHEACQLVLQAAAIGKGGDLLILDMGEPVKIRDLAETMIRLYASRPIDIVYTGLRPGEKLYEELLLDESEKTTAYESIMIARSSSYPIVQLQSEISQLKESPQAIKILQKIVPEFTHQGTQL